MEIVKTGDLERIQTETTEDVVTAKLFMTIYGVGKTLVHYLATTLVYLLLIRAKHRL